MFAATSGVSGAAKRALAITHFTDIITGQGTRVHFSVYYMQLSRAVLVLLLTLALSLQVVAAGGDDACHHEHATASMMAQMDDDCGEHTITSQQPCCDNDCQCASHMVHCSAFIPEENALTVVTKPAFQRLFALQQQVRQPHFPHYRPPRNA